MELLQDRPDIINMVKSVAQDQGIGSFIITDVQTNEKGEGYLGQIFMVAVEDTVSDKKLDLVIKAAFTDETIRNLAPIELSFQNEILFYTEIHPAFKKLELESGILQATKLVPECYQVSNEKGKELLCLENLKTSNFEVFDKTILLGRDHISLIFQTYGCFHAHAFALQDQKQEEYGKLVSKTHNILSEFLNHPNGGFKKHFRDFGALVQSYLVPGEDDDIIEKFEKYTGDGIVEQLSDIVTGTWDYSCILHGDCWSNNMMFKYETSGGEKTLVDMRILDMQLVKVGSPVCDLSYSLYSGGSKAVFDNLSKYLAIYYESFSSVLKQLGSDPEKLFPFEVLKSHWKKYSKFGLIMAIAVLKMKSTSKEDLVDFTDFIDADKSMDLVAQVKFNEEEFKERVKDLLGHMADIDAL